MRFVSVLLLVLSASPALAAPADDAASAWQKGDAARATSIWASLAQGNDPDALYNLGQAHRLGRGVPKDAATAVDFYRRADRAGHAKAGEQLGLMLFGEGATRSEALQLLERAARQGAPRASYVLAVEHLEGKRVRRDPDLARTYLQRAAEAGIPNAKELLASFTVQKPLAPLPAAPVNVPPPVSLSRASVPNLSPSPSIVAPTSAMADWNVTLGHYRTMSSAAVKWLRISAREKLRSQNARFDQTGGGVRLAIGPFSQSSAQQLCARLAADKVKCTLSKDSPR